MIHPSYTIRLEDQQAFASDRAVTEFLIYAAVKACSPNLNSSESMIFGGIQESLTRDEDLDSSQKEWILDKLEKAEMPFNLSMWRRALIKHLRNGSNQ